MKARRAKNAKSLGIALLNTEGTHVDKDPRGARDALITNFKFAATVFRFVSLAAIELVESNRLSTQASL